MRGRANANLRAIVDMGSNGIRFSITDVSPETARVLPIVYQDRAAISLYDAQWESGEAVAISSEVISAVVNSLKTFKKTCLDHGVLPEHIRIVATEATRTAKNSNDLQAAIKDGTGLTVEMYPKEVEGLVGAYGVASSFETVRGLVMDLGGGSTQLTWIISPDSSKERISMSEKFSVSMPYGAAAMARRLKEATRKGEKAREELKKEVIDQLKAAVEDIKMPQELKDQATTDGLNLYLSGGGFRGWGYVLMSQHPVQPYPIPIINGFHVTADSFYDTLSITEAVQSSAIEDSKIFRVSSRRATQVPAVAFLVSCLVEALPVIKNVFFCQGGVREGTLFRDIEPQHRAIDPLLVACRAHAPPSPEPLRDLLFAAIPKEALQARGSGPASRPRNTGLDIGDVEAFASCMYQQDHLPKDIRAAAALRSTTYGHFAATHGLSHFRRAALAIFLCERYGGQGELSPADTSFYHAMKSLLPELEAWWCLYLGRLAAVLAYVFPAGIVHGKTLKVESKWLASDERSSSSSSVKKGKETNGATGGDDDDNSDAGHHGKAETLVLKMRFYERDDGFIWTEGMDKSLKELSKAGKKKSWVGKDRKFKLRIELERVNANGS